MASEQNEKAPCQREPAKPEQDTVPGLESIVSRETSIPRLRVLLRGPFLKECRRLGLHPTPQQLDQFAVLVAWHRAWCSRIGLSKVLRPRDVIVKHLVDSLLAAQFVRGRKPNCLDVGSGAGFPGLPLRIALPTVRLWVLDSRRKVASYLHVLAHALGLHDITIARRRAEELAAEPGLRRSFDLVLARALAPPEKALPLCWPLVAPNGRLALFLAEGKEESARDTVERAALPQVQKIQVVSAKCEQFEWERSFLVVQRHP